MIKRIILASFICAVVAGQYASAYDQFFMDQDITTYDPNASGLCSTPSAINGAGALPENASATGAIEGAKTHQASYEQVGQAKDVPWQMLAAIHYRETTYGTDNPGNGQGIFQFFSRANAGERFPPGPTTDAEFVRQLELLAHDLKGRYSDTPIANLKGIDLSAGGSDARKVKDVFFSYNGRADKYAEQAAKLGFDRNNDPFEGSPYVMNLYDSKRTPIFNQGGWGGFYADGKFGYYPQYKSTQVGAFVLYEALGGSTVGFGGSCNGINASGNRIVDIARAELAKQVSEDPAGCDGPESIPGSCGPEIDKYTDGWLEYWCADFVSWVYKEAGTPFDDGQSGGWRQASTVAMLEWFEEKGTYEPRNSANPQPGDVIFFKSERNDKRVNHVGIVDSVSADGSVKTIEGNTSTTFTSNGSGVGSHTYDYRTNTNVVGFGRMGQ